MKDDLMPYFDKDKVEQKFFCNECGNLFSEAVGDDDMGHMECPACNSYKISLQFDLWHEIDPEVDDIGEAL